MSCEGCTEKQREINEQKAAVYQRAIKAAQADGVWYGIYTDEYGYDQIIRADAATGYPIKAFISPNVSNAYI